VTKKYTKLPYNIPIGLKVLQMAAKYYDITPLQGPPEHIKIGIFI
jgi:hypothetical protein